MPLPESDSLPITRIWVAALVLLCVMLWGLFNVASPASSTLESKVDLHGDSVVAIGTSLMGRGLDWKSDLLETAMGTKRLARNGMSPNVVLNIAEESLRQGARLMIIEAQPFLLNQRSFSWADPLNRFNGTLYKTLGRVFRRPALQIFGLKNRNSEVWIKDLEVDPTKVIDWERMKRHYPRRLIKDLHRERLLDLADASARNGAQLLFVAMPISQSAAFYNGVEYREAFDLQLRRFGIEHGVEVWTPDFAWSDDHFFDRAHLNKKGRVRFTAELKAFLQ